MASLAPANVLVQLGGLEPPTSCSTDRRSNQLSYNCIIGAPEMGSPNGAETRCNAALWQGRWTPRNGRFRSDKSSCFTGLAGKNRCVPGLWRGAQNKKPGLAARAFFWSVKPAYQAAGLNSFDALALIGSAVSAATF
jgi:hypothetical protein